MTYKEITEEWKRQVEWLEVLLINGTEEEIEKYENEMGKFVINLLKEKNKINP